MKNDLRTLRGGYTAFVAVFALAWSAGCAPKATRGSDPDSGVSAGGQNECEYALERDGGSLAVGDDFRPCAEDRDCVLVGVDCNGCCDRDAIAANLEGRFEECSRNACQGYRGAICDCSYRALAPRCIESKCRAIASDQVAEYQLQRKDANVVIPSVYRNCARDSDCMFVETSCAGCCERDAITATLEPTYRQNHRAACADYRGAICDCEFQPAEARCIDSACTHVPTE